MLDRIVVLIVAFNRFESTKRVLASVKTHLPGAYIYVSQDGVRDPDDREYFMLKELLISEAESNPRLVLIPSEVNLGCRRNVMRSVTLVSEISQYILVLEDDLILNSGVEEFLIESIAKEIPLTCLYRHSFVLGKKDYVSRRFSSWGWFVGRDYWLNYLSSAKDCSKNTRWPDLNRQIRAANKGKINSWALCFAIYCLNENTQIRYPGKSLIMNTGFVGKGTHTISGKKGNRVLPEFFSGLLKKLYLPNQTGVDFLYFLFLYKIYK